MATVNKWGDAVPAHVGLDLLIAESLTALQIVSASYLIYGGQMHLTQTYEDPGGVPEWVPDQWLLAYLLSMDQGYTASTHLSVPYWYVHVTGVAKEPDEWAASGACLYDAAARYEIAYGPDVLSLSLFSWPSTWPASTPNELCYYGQHQQWSQQEAEERATQLQLIIDSIIL
jgi:hypothetical protein